MQGQGEGPGDGGGGEDAVAVGAAGVDEELAAQVRSGGGEAFDEGARLALVEVVVLITSGLIGETLKSVRFAEKYNAVVLALRRRGMLDERPSTTPLHAGDVLVLEGEMSALQELAETPGFVVIGQITRPQHRPGTMVITLLTLVAVIAMVSFGLLPIVTAATAGCAILILTGCLRPREAYQAIDLSLVFLLSGSLALGIALGKTGITDWLARGLAGMAGETGPYLVLAGFFIVSVLVSELMSNSGTVALLGPLARGAPLNPIAQNDFTALDIPHLSRRQTGRADSGQRLRHAVRDHGNLEYVREERADSLAIQPLSLRRGERVFR